MVNLLLIMVNIYIYDPQTGKWLLILVELEPIADNIFMLLKQIIRMLLFLIWLWQRLYSHCSSAYDSTINIIDIL